ncbi:hypothetical protein KXW98_005434 [Aspergillus fumigatus]|uniref:Uncharacterized protein n=1 Tax=Aspergillus fumigatus TaxID=746128 RepID=A0A229XID1_ASPFM|nr:hypothetical protein KXX11_007995 [Aspergillus fumigatus]KMK60863.1 hypothetical protein Y699_02064 [Aspergillus fumigatus Z5]KAH1342512.1 hypothetical protein KXX67_006399 [Aspergillus fumigatus]KAH1366678.1 hypothetical protein KXX14_005179 [Aspergillus fumigatus]KAH1382972.1 hypothetical protein KXX10_006066 [Aspergillus fumigatus]
MGNANYSAQQQVLIFKGTLAALTTIGVTATTEMTSSASMISSTTTGGPSPAASTVAAETNTSAPLEPNQLGSRPESSQALQLAVSSVWLPS